MTPPNAFICGKKENVFCRIMDSFLRSVGSFQALNKPLGFLSKLDGFGSQLMGLDVVMG